MEDYIPVIAILATAIILFFAFKKTSPIDEDPKFEPAKEDTPPTPTPEQVEASQNAGLAQLGLPSVTELRKLTKKQIDAKAEADGVKLDARQTKEKMIKAYRDELKKLG